MSSFVRIRLSFERPLSLAEVKNCWFLVETSTCRTIADLEYLIKKRFGALSKVSGSSINLFLDDYLLPSQEKIEIIQQNDNIRVELKQVEITKTSSDEDESSQDTAKKVKRKKKNTSVADTSLESRQKFSKKSSLPSTSSKSKLSKTSQDKSNKHSKHELKSSSSSKKLSLKSSAGKRKSANESSNSSAKKSKISANGIGKDFAATKIAIDKDSESSSSSQSSSESSDESGPCTSHSKDSTILNGVKSSDSKATKGRPNCDKLPFHGGLGKDVQTKSLSKLALPKGKTETNANGVTSKSSSVLQGTKKGKSTAKESSLSSSSSESSETEESVRAILKNTTKKNLPSSSSSLSTSLSSQSSLSLSTENAKENAKSGNNATKSKDVIRKVTRKKSSSSSSSSSSQSSSSENEKEDACDAYKTTETLSHMRPLSSPSSVSFSSNANLSNVTNTPLLLPLSSWSSRNNKQRDMNVSSINQSMTSNFYEKAKPTRQVHALQRTSGQGNGTPGSSHSTGHIRFDSEDESIEGQEQVCLVNNITADFNATRPYPITTESEENDQTNTKKAVEQKVQEPAQRNYSLCTQLHGPPRSGDKIAYKVLELSASYTPEVSSYKEGTVLSYDPSSGIVQIKLTKESLKKTRGDGNLTRKFELVFDDDEENEENASIEEADLVVVVLWSSMLDPVLISD